MSDGYLLWLLWASGCRVVSWGAYVLPLYWQRHGLL